MTFSFESQLNQNFPFLSEGQVTGRGCSTKDKVFYKECETHSYGDQVITGGRHSGRVATFFLTHYIVKQLRPVLKNIEFGRSSRIELSLVVLLLEQFFISFANELA
jgi:hypothetical protein